MHKPDRAGHFAFRGLGFSRFPRSAQSRVFSSSWSHRSLRGQPGRERHLLLIDKSKDADPALIYRGQAAVFRIRNGRRRLQRDSEVPKSTRTQVRVSSARARGKRPPEVEDPTQLSLVLFIYLKKYSFVYNLSRQRISAACFFICQSVLHKPVLWLPPVLRGVPAFRRAPASAHGGNRTAHWLQQAIRRPESA